MKREYEPSGPGRARHWHPAATCAGLIAFLALPAALSGQQPGSLAGTVYGPTDRPVAAAHLRLMGDGAEVARAVALIDGTFRLEGIQPGPYTVRVVAAGFGTLERRVRVGGGPGTTRVTLRLAAAEPVPLEPLRVQAAAPRSTASSALFRREQLSVRQVDTPGDVLRVVPGLVIARHGGGGKADQFLIRGFDADHGTDFALYFDGIPVNMVSHAHGQGYADLHFLIPETLESIEVYKGPYFAEYGNLATAGAAQLRLRNAFEAPFARVEVGSFHTLRGLAGWSPKADASDDGGGVRGFVAAEAYRTDGPFLQPQGLERYNAATRWRFPLGPRHAITAFATGYEGQWNASGQIPLRAVESGSLDRFGAVDPTEGGTSSRYNVSVSHGGRLGAGRIASQVYLSLYDLALFSNFTFFLNDPVHGDGILQTDERSLFGGHVRYQAPHRLLGLPGSLTAGADYRQDEAVVGLFEQVERRVAGTLVHSDLSERNLGLYVEQKLEVTSRVRAIAGLRYDAFGFQVRSRTGEGPAGAEARDILLPKASLIVTPTGRSDLELFFNYGRGFHGNDARAVVSDPNAVVLAPARGYELGVLGRWKGLEVSLDYFLLDLDGELVWVGDEGVTELSGPTRRHGPELELVWRPREGLLVDGTVTRVFASFRESGDPVARAPRLAFSGGIGWRSKDGSAGSLRVRGIGDFPLDEAQTFQGDGFALVDVVAAMPVRPWLRVGGTIENLLNAKAKEAQTFFASRLRSEGLPREDNHFTPANPLTFRLTVKVTP